MPTQRYLAENVVEAAQRRIRFIFDAFQNVIVSISGGKDSTVLAYLAVLEAARRGRKVGLFFLDEEVVYQSTIDQVEYLMGLDPPHINRLWLQVEFYLSNAVSLEESQLLCWEAGKHKIWMRPKGRNNICAPPWGKTPKHQTACKGGVGFYDAIQNFEECYTDTAFVVGLRATESPNRWRTMVNHPVDVQGTPVYWGTNKGRGNAALYPLYDWNFHDVWKFIATENIRYSKLYDWQFRKGMRMSEIRCSSLIHERSFKSICELPEFEPKTYDRLLKRIKGISFAQETGKNSKMFQVRKRPKAFTSWRAYRDFLLSTYPDQARKPLFVQRFAKHLDNEYVARQQCRQLILTDYENNLPVDNAPDPREALLEYYRRVL